jgi:hypothetical protein
MKLTISEAAAHLGYRSRTVLYRLLRDGLLKDYQAGRDGRTQLLESHPPGRCSLRDHVAACVQLRHDSPLGHRADPLPAISALDAAPSVHWQRIAELVNGFLGPDWPAPPWSAEQVNTLCMAVSLAEDVNGHA